MIGIPKAVCLDVVGGLPVKHRLAAPPRRDQPCNLLRHAQRPEGIGGFALKPHITI